MKFADKNHHNFMCVQLSGLEILVYDCLDEVRYRDTEKFPSSLAVSSECYSLCPLYQ